MPLLLFKANPGLLKTDHLPFACSSPAVRFSVSINSVSPGYIDFDYKGRWRILSIHNKIFSICSQVYILVLKNALGYFIRLS